jgi:hypothetical protein
MTFSELPLGQVELLRSRMSAVPHRRPDTGVGRVSVCGLRARRDGPDAATEKGGKNEQTRIAESGWPRRIGNEVASNRKILM